MRSRRRALSWVAGVAAAVAAFGLILFFADPRGNPDRGYLLWVTLVFSLAAGALVQSLLSPGDRIGGSAGLGSVPFAQGFSVVTLAVSGLAFAFLVLRHPVIAACISSLAAVGLVFHRPIVKAFVKICWGVPLFGRPCRCAVWKAELARLQAKEPNEAASAGLSELLVLCAKQPDAAAGADKTAQPGNAELDSRISGLILRLQELAGEGDVEMTLAEIERLKICLAERAKLSDQGV